jgi:hypothetical protein
MAHWYSADGTRVDVVVGSKGQPVAPDLRHARKNNLACGVTTIIKCAAAEALVVYRERQVLMAALTLPRSEQESDEDYCARVMRDSKQHAEEAALAGTALHAEIEHGINDPANDNAWVQAARAALVAQYGQREWFTEHSAVSCYGFATKSDLCSPPTVGNNGAHRPVVVDIKSKDGPLDELKTYDEHHMQLAATAQALGWSVDRQCAILFLRRDQPEARLVIVEHEKLQRGWQMFGCLLRFWQHKNNYKPAWAQDIPYWSLQ